MIGPDKSRAPDSQSAMKIASGTKTRQKRSAPSAKNRDDE